MPFKNNVIRLLDQKRIVYEVHTYDYAAGIHSAVDVATALGKAPQTVCKTLVAQTDPPGRRALLAVVPGPETLDLKALARAAGAKKIKMAPHAAAERLTGLKTGGISPLALINKAFDVYLDERALNGDRIVLSAGERGVQVELPIEDFVRLTGARVAPLTASDA